MGRVDLLGEFIDVAPLRDDAARAVGVADREVNVDGPPGVPARKDRLEVHSALGIGRRLTAAVAALERLWVVLGAERSGESCGVVAFAGVSRIDATYVAVPHLDRVSVERRAALVDELQAQLHGQPGGAE